MAKGASFEREICKALGLWWTNGERDDIFWRSSNSGGRATVRHRKGRSTFGQYGDIQATDPVGQSLMDLCTIELKRGYGLCSIADVLDKSTTAAEQKWEEWVQQAMKERNAAQCLYWLLITRRDRREALMHMPFEFYQRLNEAGANIHKARPCARHIIPGVKGTIFTLPFTEFTRTVRPDFILKVRGRWQ